MSTAVELLDSWTASREESWDVEMELSLGTGPDAWLAAADDGELTRDRWWVLLSWVERAASAIAATRRAELVELVAFALSVLEDGPVDGREAMAIAALVRRGASHAGLDFLALIRPGCARAGSRGEQCLRWLSRASDRLYRTHREVGQGTSFRFERVPSNIDVDALTRWAKGEK